jgi:hypothetical protein
MDWNIILLGCAGGAVPDIVRIVQNRHEPNLPDYLKGANFWLGFFLLLILGGVAAGFGDAKSIKEALAYGFTAPEVISRLFSAPSGARGPGGGMPIRRWWSL